MKILAIDPAPKESGIVIIRMPEFKVIWGGKIANEDILGATKIYNDFDVVVIERIASYGMAVGKTVFETCEWVGRFTEQFKEHKVDYVYRKEEKMCLCGTCKAKDTNIKQALIDRYAKFDFKQGKGTKDEHDTFYGVHHDMWAAIAVGVTYYEKEKGIWT